MSAPRAAARLLRLRVSLGFSFRPLLRWRRRLGAPLLALNTYAKSAQARSSFEPDEKQNQIDNEQQHNRRVEDQDQANGLVVLGQLIQVGKWVEFFIDRPVPIDHMKAGG